MNRREWIKSMGTGIIMTVAGCGSDSPSGENNQERSNTPTQTEPPAPARFEVVEYNIPETIEIDENVAIKITIRNIGEQTGDFGAPLYVRTPDRALQDEWQRFYYWTAKDVSPGDTVTIEKPTNRVTQFVQTDYLRQVEYRLGESSHTATVQTVPAQYSWGEGYTTPQGYVIRVSQPAIQDAYDHKILGETIEHEPEDGGQWAFIDLYVKNDTGQTKYSPAGSDFDLIYGNSQVENDPILSLQPINKGDQFEPGELRPGVERSGWVIYRIENGVSVSDVTIAWSKRTSEGEVAVNWS